MLSTLSICLLSCSVCLSPTSGATHAAHSMHADTPPVSLITRHPVSAIPSGCDSVPTADAHPVARLTGDILTKMTTFWTRFQQEPDSIQILGRQINQARLQRLFFSPRPTAVTPPPTVSTFVALAARYPAVAADFHAAGLTAAQWDASCPAFFRALILNNNLTNSLRNTFKRVNPTPHTAIDTANGQFLNTHAHEGDALIATLYLIDQINTVVNAELQNGRSHQVVNP